MLSTSYNGQTVYLLDLPPSWDNPFTADVSLLSQTEVSLSNIEARRPHSTTLRFRTKYTILADGPATRRLSGALRLLTQEPVLAPMWPAASTWSTYAAQPITSGWYLVFKDDWSQWAIFGGGGNGAAAMAAPGWPVADDNVVPLIWGFLQSRKLNWLNPDMAQFDVDHIENSPANWAITPAAAAFTAGPLPSPGWPAAPLLFPFQTCDTKTDAITVTVLRETVGLGRVQAQTFYPQSSAREQETPHFLGTLAKAASLLSFFQQCAGGAPFWAPGFTSAVVLTAPVGAADTDISVEDTNAVQVGDMLAFLGPTGMGIGQVEELSAGTVNMAAAVGAFDTDTLVAPLMLMRFQRPAITLDWQSAAFVTCKMQTREVPAEIIPPANEVIGETLSVLPTRCYLYQLSTTINGVTATQYLTSFESNLTNAGNTYIASGFNTGVNISHGDITQGLMLENDEVDLLSDLPIGGALLDLLKLQLEAPLYLVILSAQTADSATATNTAVIYTGEITTAALKGNRITGKAVSAGSLFDRKPPRMVFQPTCNFGLFTAGCCLLLANWKFTGAVTAAVPGYPFALTLNTLALAVGALPAIPAQFFAGGWIEYTAAGGKCQRRAILQSTALAAGSITLNLERDLSPWPNIGNSVTLYPGCDLTSATCQARFNNYNNFGGHPLIAVVDPSALMSQGIPSAGGKK